MAAPRSTAAHASVVFLKIPEYSQQPVTEQVRLKDRLEGVVTAALSGLDPSSRIVLEAPDGAAVVVLGDPEAALGLAQRSSVGGSVPLAVGLSHGPVRVAGGDTTPIVLGDALAVAQAVSGLSTPGRVAATREFREALKRAAPGLARFLAPAGMHTDARDRAYEVFLADRQSWEKRRCRWLATMACSFAAIVAAGI
jgi:class 3 adenylate cyclase